jgi:membrane associated rhomboid family serine protease
MPMSSDPDASPFNALPPVVVALALPIFLVEVALSAAARGLIGGQVGIGWRSIAIEDHAFFPRVVSAMVARQEWPLEHVMRFGSYLFVHVSFVHMLFATVILLAMGNMVGAVFRSWGVLAVFLGSGLAGAFGYWVVMPSGPPLIGAYPAVYGMIGAYTFLLWVRLTATGGPQHQAFYLIAFLMGIQLVFGLLFGTGPDWIGDVFGFIGGFALSFVVSPGGWGRVMRRLRRG